MTFGAHKLVRSEPFWTTNANFDNCCQHCVAPCAQHLYRCTFTFPALMSCGWILLKTCCYLYEVVRTNFSPIFGVFAIFDRKLANNVAPPGDGNKQTVVHLKVSSLRD